MSNTERPQDTEKLIEGPPKIKFNEKNIRQQESESDKSQPKSEIDISNGRRQQLLELKQVVNND
jgi:hypothetical protein